MLPSQLYLTNEAYVLVPSEWRQQYVTDVHFCASSVSDDDE